MADKMPTIGNRTGGTSYPKSDAGKVGKASETMLEDNANIQNFPTDPEVFNASPATKKSYSWNKGASGNAT